MPEPSRLLPGQRSAANSQRTDAPAGVGFHRTPGRRCTIERGLAVAATHGGADASVEYVVALPDRLREVEEIRTPRLSEPELIESLWHRTAEPLPHRFEHLVLVHQALILRLQNQNRGVTVGLVSAELLHLARDLLADAFWQRFVVLNRARHDDACRAVRFLDPDAGQGRVWEPDVVATVRKRRCHVEDPVRERQAIRLPVRPNRHELVRNVDG